MKILRGSSDRLLKIFEIAKIFIEDPLQRSWQDLKKKLFEDLLEENECRSFEDISKILIKNPRISTEE